MNYLPDCLRRGWCMISTRIAQWVGRKPESKTNLNRYFLEIFGFSAAVCHDSRAHADSDVICIKSNFFPVSRIWKRTFSTFLLAWTEKCGDFFPPFFPPPPTTHNFPFGAFSWSLSKVQEEKSGNGMGQKKEGKTRVVVVLFVSRESQENCEKSFNKPFLRKKCQPISRPPFFVLA